MPRTARVVVAGVPHHVTQRGNRRQQTFFGPRDYQRYLAIAVETFADWAKLARQRACRGQSRARSEPTFADRLA